MWSQGLFKMFEENICWIYVLTMPAYDCTAELLGFILYIFILLFLHEYDNSIPIKIIEISSSAIVCIIKSQMQALKLL